MTVAFVKTFATNLLEYENLVGSGVVSEHCSLHYRTLYIRSADLYLALVVHEKDLVELHSCTFCFRKAVAKDLIACLNFKLLACNINNSVHKKTLLKSFDRKRIPSEISYRAPRPSE